MRISRPLSIGRSHICLEATRSLSTPSIDPHPLISIRDATFYRRQPSAHPTKEEALTNPPLFPHLNFSFPSKNTENQYWAIIGPSNAGKTTLLEILQSQHQCFPPTARSYPYLSSDEIFSKNQRLAYPSQAIQYVGFDNRRKDFTGAGSYLSARYESRREATDFSLLDYLTGQTQLNIAEMGQDLPNEKLLEESVKNLRLENLLLMPVSNLSNGQSRRARIAKALLSQPELLLLDEPFMGLDPPTTIQLSPLLRHMAYTASPRLLLALRVQDPIPDWITHIIFLKDRLRLTHVGEKKQVEARLLRELEIELAQEDQKIGVDGAEHQIPQQHLELGRILTDSAIFANVTRSGKSTRNLFDRALKNYKAGNRSERTLERLGMGRKGLNESVSERKAILGPAPVAGEPLIEMHGVVIKYGDQTALGSWNQQLELKDVTGQEQALLSHEESREETKGLHWTLRRGQRWAVVGPNGSGKTTLASLITSDHPQAYAAPIKFFGRSRLPTPGQPGLSLFDIHARIGHSSPEVHTFFPRQLSVRAALESAYAEGPYARPKLDTTADARINAALRWFQADLNPALGMDPYLKREMFKIEDHTEPGLGPQSPHMYKAAAAKHWYEIRRNQDSAIEWADSTTFGELSFSAQRVILFLRAIVAQPDIIILDEAFSGMDEDTRNKCLLFLDHGESYRVKVFESRTRKMHREGLSKARRKFKSHWISWAFPEGLTDRQALIVISHVKEEIPRSVRNYLYLPEAGSGVPAVYGTVRDLAMKMDGRLWRAIWSIPELPRRRADEEDLKGLRREGDDRIKAERSLLRKKNTRSPTPRVSASPVSEAGVSGTHQKTRAQRRRIAVQIREKLLKSRAVENAAAEGSRPAEA